MQVHTCVVVTTTGRLDAVATHVRTYRTFMYVYVRAARSISMMQSSRWSWSLSTQKRLPRLLVRVLWLRDLFYLIPACRMFVGYLP